MQQMIIKHKGNNYADDLVTPDLIFQRCERIWGVKCILDVCANSKTSKCVLYYNKRANGLNREWNNKVIWCNPPHSKTGLWVKKAYQEWRKYNNKIVMLLPVNVLTSNYFKKYALPYIRFEKKMILSRINFLNPKTLKPSKFNSVNGYMTIFYNGKTRRRK